MAGLLGLQSINEALALGDCLGLFGLAETDVVRNDSIFDVAIEVFNLVSAIGVLGSDDAFVPVFLSIEESLNNVACAT